MALIKDKMGPKRSAHDFLVAQRKYKNGTQPTDCHIAATQHTRDYKNKPKRINKRLIRKA